MDALVDSVFQKLFIPQNDHVRLEDNTEPRRTDSEKPLDGPRKRQMNQRVAEQLFKPEQKARANNKAFIFNFR